MTQSSMSTRLTYVGTNTRRRPSRNASRIRPVPPARPGPCTEDGLTSTRSWPSSREVASAARSPSVFVRSYVDRYQPRCGVRSVPTTPGGSPIVAAEDVWTRRATPARAAARTAATAPPTFIRSIGRGSSTHSVLIPATLNTSAQPSIPRVRSSSSSPSPRTTRAPRASSVRDVASERASATTSSPRSSRRVTSAVPITPVPPVTNTRRHSGCERSAAENWTM